MGTSSRCTSLGLSVAGGRHGRRGRRVVREQNPLKRQAAIVQNTRAVFSAAIEHLAIA